LYLYGIYHFFTVSNVFEHHLSLYRMKAVEMSTGTLKNLDKKSRSAFIEADK
jgi:hypothetical protein